MLTTFVFYKRFIESDVVGFSVADNNFITFNRERLQRFASSKSDGRKLRVVSIGTSLMKFGTYPEGDADVQSEGVPGALASSWLNISQPTGHFDAFVPLLEQIIDSTPDILLIHSDLLRMKSDKSLTQEFGTQAALRSLMKRWWGGDSKKRSIIRQRNMQYRRTCRLNGFASIEESIQKRVQWYSRPITLSKRFIELVHQAQERKVAIVILHLPRQQRHRQTYAQLHAEWLSGLKTAVERFEGVALWSAPVGWGEEDYCDYRHLNENGRKKLMEWLVPRLQSLNTKGAQP